MATRVSSSRFVGRAAELTELEAALRDAAAGRPSLVFVAGESGLGKTRLISELERRAAETGARVLGGDCVELGDGELPYAPLVTALRPLARRRDEVLDRIDPRARQELAALAPSLAAASPQSLSRGAAAGADDSDARARLFEALVALLDELGSEAPALLTIEDLHWADRSTRAFLTYLSSTLCGERVLVVCTYRPDEIHRRHPLRPLLAELERDSRSHRLELRPFTREELGEQLSDILGDAPSETLLERLLTRSEGNPLFAEELLAAGLDGRGALPPTLRDALMLRIEQLPADARELLRLIAAAQRADHETLADAAGLDPRTLRDALREVVAANLVVVGDDGRYAFRHALLREVVVDDLLPGEASELHRALARALEPRLGVGAGGAQMAAAVAYHHLQAGDREPALTASMDAAQSALQVHAYGEAAALADRVLELWDQVPDAEQRLGMDHVSVLSFAANARDVDGDVARQEQLLRRALAELGDDADPARTAALLERLHHALFALNRQDDAVATLDRALALLPAGEPSPARTQLLASKAKTAMLRSRYSETMEVAHEAIASAQATGSRRGEARARNALGVALMYNDDLEAGRAELRTAWAIGLEQEDPREVGAAATNLSDMLHLHGLTREAIEVAEEGLAYTQSLAATHDWLDLAISEYEFDAGLWDSAEARIPRRMRRDVGVALMNWHLRRGEILLGRGDVEAAAIELEAADKHSADSLEPQFLGQVGALVAELRRRRGDLPGARRAVLDALDAIEFCSEDYARIARVACVGVRIEADAAQHARDLGDAEAADSAAASAELLAARVDAAASPARPVERAYAVTAHAELGRARGADDPSMWTAAARAWEELERPYLEALTLRRAAEAHIEDGDRDAAAEAASHAREVAARIGARWLCEEVEGLIARARLRVAAEDGPDAGDAAAAGDEPDADPFGLTARERQVLALVANGRTNREIGEALFMAEKTASVHVSRILAKLDVRSRTEAAGVAHRFRLAD